MDNVNYDSLTYGFSSTTATLAVSAMIASVIKAVRTRQFYGRYFLMFVAGTFAFVRAILEITFLVHTSGTFKNTALNRNLMARLFLGNMFVPLMYCTFIEVCRAIILTRAPSQKHSVPKSYPAYSAYLWTAVLAITNIIRSGLGLNSLQSGTYGISWTMRSLTSLNHYGVWILFVLATVQIFSGFKELQDCIISLLSFFVTVMIANIADTIDTTIPGRYTNSVIMFIMMDLVGLLGLWFALWASSRYWPRQSKSVVPDQTHYGYNMPSPRSGVPFVSQTQATYANGKGSLKDQTQQHFVTYGTNLA